MPGACEQVNEMADFKIAAEPRTVIGKQVKQLRAQGIVPAVLYGGAYQGVPIQCNDVALRTIFRKGAHKGEIELELDGKAETVVVQELTRHLTRGDLLHIDFRVVQ